VPGPFGDDELLARQLQEAELGLYHPPQRESAAADGNVVTGRPVGPVTMGAPSPGEPGVIVVLGPELPRAEMIALSYRLALACFATIDLVTSILNAASSPASGGRWFGLWGMIFIVGPVCGLCGARTFNRPLIAIYLCVCMLKACFQTASAIVFLFQGWFFIFLWFALVAFVQLWICKIVFEFWRALGAITPERRRELAEGKIDAPVRMVYW